MTYRNIATCANGIPHLPDAWFKILNPQNPLEGLTKLGKKIAQAAIANGIILDVTHCSDRAQEEVFELAASYHPKVPVVSSHAGVRCRADHQLNLSDYAIDRIAELGGVIGTIIYPYWLRKAGSTDDGLDLVTSTIDYIAGRTGGYDHVAIGTDMDGFIEPVRQCPNYSQIAVLEQYLRQRYEKPTAEKVLWRNALRVLQEAWGAPRH
jgi:microsomal dipeptidase-like Zn-dependent dipeptidase